jgi:transcription antitermination protein NusB
LSKPLEYSLFYVNRQAKIDLIKYNDRHILYFQLDLGQLLSLKLIMLTEKTENQFAKKHVARFLATMALYSQQVQENKNLAKCCELIKNSYLSKDLFAESDPAFNQLDLHEIDNEFLNSLIQLVERNRLEINNSIKSCLIEKYNFDRLDRVIRSVLTLATAEILYCAEIPAKIIIDEYVSIVKTFYENNEAGFVNKVVDVIARKFRHEEINQE